MLTAWSGLYLQLVITEKCEVSCANDKPRTGVRMCSVIVFLISHVFRYCLSDIVNRKNGSHSVGDTACDLTFRMGRNLLCRGRLHHKIKHYWKGLKSFYLDQSFSVFLPWRNPWNHFQVSGNPCIKIIISTAHGTLAWSVSCRYNNPIIIIVNALLSRELYFSVDLFILDNKFRKRCLFFSNHDLSRNP
jgi:hypothetical protein